MKYKGVKINIDKDKDYYTGYFMLNGKKYASRMMNKKDKDYFIQGAKNTIDKLILEEKLSKKIHRLAMKNTFKGLLKRKLPPLYTTKENEFEITNETFIPGNIIKNRDKREKLGEKLLNLLSLQRQTYIRTADNQKIISNHIRYNQLENEIEIIQEEIGKENKKAIKKESKKNEKI
jgi:hypothetical protein